MSCLISFAAGSPRTANILLAWACLFGEVSSVGLPTPNFGPGVVVTSIASQDSSAVSAGLRVGDRLVAIDGVEGEISKGQDGVNAVISDIRSVDFFTKRGRCELTGSVYACCSLGGGLGKARGSLSCGARTTRP